MKNAIEVKNIVKKYKNFTLDNVSFDVPKGYIMGFIGENGAGKTTTIKAIMNALTPNSGEIKVFGLDNKKHEVEIKEKIGFVYAEFDFFINFKLKDIKKYIAPFYKNWDEELYQKYMKKFELNPKSKINKISTGMKTKFALALALSHHAELLILDEPTSGLDPVFRDEFLDMLLDIVQDEQKTILFSTHITSDLDKIADYITYIHKGKIVFSKERDQIYENYYVVKGDLQDLLGKEKVFIGIKKNKYGFEALTNNVSEVKKDFGENINLERATLEEIMVFYNRKGNK
ncbi:MAG: ABC transporter ATP-binding protein [Tissierellales bacterium]|nr:ABC transporter ATP-binding protein [Tissierellales bacterium]